MKSQDLPQDSSPLSPLDFWRESLSAWSDFSQRTAQIVTSQLGQSAAKKGQKVDPAADTLSSELLRSFSDLNLRHWQNTALLLEGLPAWTRLPNTMTSSVLVDLYDHFQRVDGAAYAEPEQRTTGGEKVARVAPKRLTAPSGEADDLTLIKGIGRKRSKKLNKLGIYHFSQIAAFSDSETRWIDNSLERPGGVARDEWVQQARVLCASGRGTPH